jgi:predicted phosphodiesterase
MRILVLSDIHANLPALEAVLAAAGRPEAVWCLGDTVGYGPQPNECVERLRSLPGVHCVAGNHDWAAVGKMPIDEFNLEAQVAAQWTAEQLTPANRAWLMDLQERKRIDDEFTLVHGSPRHPIWEYVLTPEVASANLAHFSTRLCLVGHTHLPVIFEATTPESLLLLLPGEAYDDRATRALINPGSVGQPRDGDARASFVILERETATLTYQRVEYDVAATQAAMRAAGLPVALRNRLAFGR